MANMKSRAQAIGAVLEIDSQPAKTRIKLVLLCSGQGG